MLPETIGCVIAELDSAIHGEHKPIQQQYRNSINMIDFKTDDLCCTFLPMDCRIKFGNDGFTFQAALIFNCATSDPNTHPAGSACVHAIHPSIHGHHLG